MNEIRRVCVCSREDIYQAHKGRAMNWLKVITIESRATRNLKSFQYQGKLYGVKYSYATGYFYWKFEKDAFYPTTRGTAIYRAEQCAHELNIRNAGFTVLNDDIRIDMNTVNLEMLGQMTLLKEQTERKHANQKSS
jgi:hypothetical protein